MTTRKLKQTLGWLATVIVAAAILSALLPISYAPGAEEKASAEQAEKEKQVLEKFDKAAALIREGKYAEARPLLIEVRDSGIELGFFRTRELNSYLQKVDEQQKKVAPTPTSAKKEDFYALYDKGIALFNAGKYSEAKAAFLRVQQSGTNLGFLKNRRLKRYLVEVDQKLASAAKPAPPTTVAKAPEKPQEKMPVPPAAKAKPTPPPPEAPKVERKVVEAKPEAMPKRRVISPPSAEAKAPAPPPVAAKPAEAVKEKPAPPAPAKPAPAAPPPAAEKPAPAAVAKGPEAKPTPTPAPAPAKKEDFSLLYDKGVALFKAGKYAEAKDAFLRVQQSGTDLGFFKNWGLKRYLTEVDEKIAQAAKPAPVAKAPEVKPGPAPPKEDFAALYDQGVKLYNEGKYEKAKEVFVRIRDSKADLGFFKNLGLKGHLRDVDAKLAEAAKPKPAPVAPKPVAEAKPAPAVAKAPEVKPAPTPVAPKPAAEEKPVAKAPEAKPAPTPAPAVTKAPTPKPAPAAAKAPAPPPSPSEQVVKDMTALYYKAIELYGQGKYKEALEAFTKVKDSGVSLGWWQNRKLASYLSSSREEINRQAMAQATEDARKAREEEAKNLEKDREKARKEFAEKVAAPLPEGGPPGSTAEQKYLAAKELYDKALKLYSEERYAEARDVFKQVQDSGVSFGWWNNRRLKYYLADSDFKAQEQQKMAGKLTAAETAPPAPSKAAPAPEAGQAAPAAEVAPPRPKRAPAYEAAAPAPVSQDARARSFMEELAKERQISEQRNRALAEHHAQMGEKYYNEANYPKAREELEKALKLSADVPKARELYDKTLALLGVSENKVKDFAQKLTEERSVRIEQKQLQMENKLREGVRLLKAEKYDEALRVFEEVKVDLEFLKHDIDIAPYLDHVESLMELASKRKSEGEKQLLKQRKDEAAKQAAEDEARQKEVSQEKLQAMYDQAYNAFVKKQFNDVKRVCKDILDLDPNNAAAEELKEQARLQQDKKTWEDLHKMDVEEHEKNRQYLKEISTPRLDTVTYPEKDAWEEITRRDPVAYPEEKPPSEKEAVLKETLKAKRVDINFEATPLADVVNFLKTLVDVNILLDPNLEDKEIKERLISLSLTDVTLGAALDFICGKDLIYVVKNDAIFITTKEALKGELSIQVYDVRDLLLCLIDRPAQPFTLAEGGSGAAAGGGGAGGLSFGEGGGGGGGESQRRSAKGRDIQDIDLQRRGHDLIELIVRVTGAQNWDNAFVVGKLDTKDYLAGEEGEAAMEQIAGVGGGGGGEGAAAGSRTIAFRNGDLIVRQTTDIHDEIKLLLSRMRETLYLQVTIDARFLSVTDDFYQEIGTDITNLLFRSDRFKSMNLDAPWSGPTGAGFPFTRVATSRPGGSWYQRGRAAGPGTPMGVPPAIWNTLPAGYPQGTAMPWNRFILPGYTSGDPTQAVPTLSANLFGLTNPFDEAGALTPFSSTRRAALDTLFSGRGWDSAGLNLGLSFLSDLQASLLIKLVQDSTKADIVSSPRVTVFNTQRANISVGLQRGYIADADVGNNGALDPQVASITTRTTLDVRPIVSADRRYVYLELFPQTRQLGQGSRGSATAPFFTVTVSSTSVSGNLPIVSAIPIMLPQQNFRIVETTVCVPDRGHLLIGGLADITEQDVESGIPVLDKIPIIKRLFSRHSTIKTRSHLLILVHPTILVKEELENKVY